MRGQGLASRRRALLAVAAVAALAPMLVAAGDDGDCGTVVDGWTFLDHPPLGPELVDVAVDPADGDHLVATDGEAVVESVDAGCTWTTMAPPQETLGDAQAGDVALSDVVFAAATGQSSRLFVLGLRPVTLAEQRPVLFRTDDAGATWRALGEGLPVVRTLRAADGCGPGLDCQVEVAPDDRDLVYVRFGYDLVNATLYVSGDGGLSFDATRTAGVVTTDGSTTTIGGGADYLDIEPLPNGLLVAANEFDGIGVSRDRGQTMRTVYAVDEITRVGASPVDLTEAGFEDAAVIHGAAEIDADAGDRFVHGVFPTGSFGTRGLELGTIRDIVVDQSGLSVMATSSGIVVTAAGTSFGSATLIGHGVVADMLRVEVSGPSLDAVVWASDRGRIARRGGVRLDPDLVPIAPPPMVDYDIIDFDPAVPVGPVPGTLVPGVDELRLEPGESAEVTYDFAVPERPLPVDVFFLFDESGSMSEEIQALRRGVSRIVNDLQARGLDLWVGVGGYARAWRYERYREIGPPDAEFQAVMQTVGSCCQEWNETAYTALHQVATGSGVPSGGARPGWDAEWRPGALRLVIHLGDEPLQEYQGDPTEDDAIRALQGERIMHLGLVSEFELILGGEDWRAITAASGAFAGPSGVDCDNDGNLDLQPGDPLLCFIPLVAATDSVSEAADLIPDMASVVVEIVDSVTEVVDISFHTDRPDVVTSLVSRPALQSYDLHSGVSSRLTATMTCSEALFGQAFPVRVTAVAHASHLATSVIQFGCGAPPPAVEVVPVEPSRPVVEVVDPPPAAAAAPAPPPPPAQAVSSATASSAAQAPAPGAQAAVAGAQQRQTQVQAAGLGHDAPRDADAPEFLATATRRPDPGGATTLLLGAGMAVVAGVTELRRRRVRRTARVPVRGLR